MTNNAVSFLKTNCHGQDVHLMANVEGFLKHLGYYFWDGNTKTHTLQLIRDMRLEIGLEAAEVRQMCIETKLIKVLMDGDIIKEISP